MNSVYSTRAATIAVVDDDEAILDSVRMALEYQGWSILTYATGEAFLADLNNHNLDCVVLDPHLSGLSGAEVARAVSNGNAHLPIIGLTAWPSSPLTTEVTNAGASVMLTKPVTSEALVGHIQAAISAVGDRQ